jgi:hypothetical protein
MGRALYWVGGVEEEGSGVEREGEGLVVGTD